MKTNFTGSKALFLNQGVGREWTDVLTSPDVVGRVHNIKRLQSAASGWTWWGTQSTTGNLSWWNVGKRSMRCFCRDGGVFLSLMDYRWNCLWAGASCLLYKVVILASRDSAVSPRKTDATSLGFSFTFSLLFLYMSNNWGKFLQLYFCLIFWSFGGRITLECLLQNSTCTPQEKRENEKNKKHTWWSSGAHESVLALSAIIVQAQNPPIDGEDWLAQRLSQSLDSKQSKDCWKNHLHSKFAFSE